MVKGSFAERWVEKERKENNRGTGKRKKTIRDGERGKGKQMKDGRADENDAREERETEGRD